MSTQLVFELPASMSRGSYRRRLWELDPHAHCPVVGVCLPMSELRRLVGKLFVTENSLNDYELHCAAIADCQQRTPFARLVQRELDRRYCQALRESGQLKTVSELAAWWRDLVQKNEVAKALWATLSHPCCTAELENEILGQVHMLQHQLGIACRLDVAKFEALQQENETLTRELAKAQKRMQQQTQTHARCVDVQQTQILQLRAKLMVSQTTLEGLQQDIQTLKASVPDLPERWSSEAELRLSQERVAQLLGEVERGERQISRLRQQRHEAITKRLSTPIDLTPQIPEVALEDQAILCVGGRTASVPIYRDLIEKTGGQFLHHDGGQEENVAHLESSLAAADLVICQTGCISHDAYWRVKNHCKRTGKPCVFTSTPSAAGLKRALVALVPQ